MILKKFFNGMQIFVVSMVYFILIILTHIRTLLPTKCFICGKYKFFNSVHYESDSRFEYLCKSCTKR